MKELPPLSLSWKSLGSRSPPVSLSLLAFGSFSLSLSLSLSPSFYSFYGLESGEEVAVTAATTRIEEKYMKTNQKKKTVWKIELATLWVFSLSLPPTYILILKLFLYLASGSRSSCGGRGYFFFIQPTRSNWEWKEGGPPVGALRNQLCCSKYRSTAIARIVCVGCQARPCRFRWWWPACSWCHESRQV